MEVTAEWILVISSVDRESINFAKNLRRKNPLIKIYLQEPVGIYPAMNFGLKKASKNSWVWFLNSGDTLFDENSLNLVKDYILTNKESLAFGFATVYITPLGKKYAVVIPKIITSTDGKLIGQINHQSFIAKKEILLSLGGFDSNLQFAADGKIIDKVVNNFPTSISTSPISYFRMGGRSQSNTLITLNEINQFRKNVFSLQIKIYYVLGSLFRDLIIKHEGNFIIRLYLKIRELRVKKILK